MDNFTCPECGHTMQRDVRPFTVAYKNLTASVDMPGWYCTHCDEAVFVGQDMDEVENVRNRLKTQYETK